jgi:hypothetical protein
MACTGDNAWDILIGPVSFTRDIQAQVSLPKEGKRTVVFCVPARLMEVVTGRNGLPLEEAIGPPEESTRDESEQEALLDKNKGEESGEDYLSEAAMLEFGKQQKLGPQSLRGKAPQFQLNALEDNEHAKACFAEFKQNEAALCGEWAVFYHSYTYAALLYEVQAAIADVLFGFPSSSAPLPRLKMQRFKEMPDAATLKAEFTKRFKKNQKDHHPEYREVAISTMCSLVSTGPEVSTPVVFIGGYKHSDDAVPFKKSLEDLLLGLLPDDLKTNKTKGFVIPRQSNREADAASKEVQDVLEQIVKIAQAHDLDVSEFTSDRSELKRCGHMLQIFVRRDLVDQLAYASAPWGDVDQSREPISRWFDDDSDTSWGQARVLAHPTFFMKKDCVRLHVASADKTFHKTRQDFSNDLVKVMRKFLEGPSRRKSAEEAILGVR